jgi:hypothetical protein
LGSTKEQRDNRRHLWSGAPDCPVHQRTPNSNSSPSGNSRGNSAIIHRTVRCTPDMSGAPRKSGLRNSPASGIHLSCSAIIHRTCPVYTGLSGVTAGQRLLQAPTATCSAFNARQHAQRSGTPMLAHRTLYSTCPVRHRTSRRAPKAELQRSNCNSLGDVDVAPDCPVHHTTDSFHQQLDFGWWL